MKKDINTKTKTLKQVLSQYNFNELIGLEPLNNWKEEYLYTGLAEFCMKIGRFLCYEDDWNSWRISWKYTYKLLEDNAVSPYQISRLKTITKTFCEAVELRETEILSLAEFMQMFYQVKQILLQKFEAIKKAHLKNKVIEKRLGKSSLMSLRAKIATLQNEN
ncbi:hypothetical protein SAMN05444360_102179 [Chryseobacterium carnipullorum]|uniref:hypothetical protein n=1 Tax=Chryseobacterium carnipullorum TaxID=1124835 RepID=UPI000912F274|nr:hypothetical protein [Chryseobacterium carnipullorum]SHL52303.1 hypothetical protein SAMN05444360_102179 [Chryseobacterium carnipullorum]